MRRALRRAWRLPDEAPERVGIEGRAASARRLGLGLEPRLAQDDADRLRGVQPLLGEQADQHGEGRDARGPGPDALGAREPALRRADLVVLRVGREASLLPEE